MYVSDLVCLNTEDATCTPNQTDEWYPKPNTTAQDCGQLWERQSHSHSHSHEDISNLPEYCSEC
jgi:hypothetical protein